MGELYGELHLNKAVWKKNEKRCETPPENTLGEGQ